MSRTSSQRLINNDEEFNYKEEEDEENNGFLKLRKRIHNSIDETEVDDLNTTVRCITLYSHRRRSHKSKHKGRQEQKNSGAATIRKQPNAKWTLEDIIDKQFKCYSQAMIPNKLEDVAQLLAPQWAAPLEMSAVGWLGDWRPSAILELLRSLAHSSYLSSLADSAETDQILLQLIREIRIEEAIIDEEMGEVQATCILHLPFRPNNQTTSSFMVPLHSVQSQLKKIKQVITKAQQLRIKVLELISNKVLNEVDAAEFLVAFSGIQDVIHQFAVRKKLQKGPVHVSAKALASV
ncbi:uncharacterized protein LOC104904703 [Beta vulgaris subsp. vulgaris]|uniref:uncharacterized protein LOC104904703 n=1 Tax=Beta vulgaris subsp. vulgaris TaxID=3555 RepID=UPI00203742AC|nr:uncharacterized protein LOC104904703 [Beta vulgaris subsp. vulgaris]